MKPLVSILIPVYNRVNLVGETIESAINQTYKNIEIIICDNCSTDGTWELLQQFAKKDSRIQIFRNKENLGPVRNWEQCLLNAKGEYANFLWSDDYIKNTFIEHTIELFDEDTGFVMTGIQIFENNSILSISKFQKKSHYSSKEYIENKIIYGDLGFPMSPACSLFRLNDLKDALYIDIPNDKGLDFNKYGAGNDLLFFLVIANKYKQIRTTKTIECYFRSHKNSFSVQSDLTIYYNTAKRFFLHNYKPSLTTKLESRIILDELLAKKKSIFSLKIKEFNLFFLLSFLAKRISHLI